MEGCTDIALKASLEEIVEKRNQSLEAFRSALIAFRSANDSFRAAVPGAYGMGIEVNYKIRLSAQCDETEMAEMMEGLRANVDRAVWSYIIDAIGMRNFMDAKAVEEFRKNLENPPEVTVENVKATIAGLRLQSGQIFRRGLVNIFRGLCSAWSRQYKSNSAFKIGPRIVLRNAVGTYWVNRREEFSDIDRIFHVLDKKQAPEHLADLGSLIGDAVRAKQTREITTPYFRVRWFKNGNAHVYFLRQDLLDLANVLIAEELGPALGEAA